MIPKLATLVFLGASVLAWAEKPNDAFAETEIATNDQSGDRKSEEFLSEDFLKACAEPRLDQGTGKERDVIRITVLRSFDAPVILKWHPAGMGQEPVLEVKSLKVINSDDGTKTYQGIDFHQRLKLKTSQERLLKEIYQHSPMQDLPEADWIGDDVLDGSLWIYEAATSNGSILITRRCPINPDVEGATIDRERLSKELQLTAFSLMLWTLSGIDELPY